MKDPVNATAFDLDAHLADRRPGVESALAARWVQGLDRLLASGQPLPDAWLQALAAGVTSGGKRLRPLLCLAAWEACTGRSDTGAALDLAVSIELIHAYSLMHDDLPSMDDAPLRRGVATPHTRFGVEATARAATLLIPLGIWSAWEAATRMAGPERGRDAGRLLARAAGGVGMVGGQAVDLASEGQSLAEAALTDLHARKTGALLTAAVELGAVGAGLAPEEPTREALRLYGRRIGLAFQIADDILDETGSAQALGKEPSDQHLDKSTYVSLLGVDGARARARSELEFARKALRTADVDSPALDGLAGYILSRTR